MTLPASSPGESALADGEAGQAGQAGGRRPERRLIHVDERRSEDRPSGQHARSLSSEADNRTLLFEERGQTSTSLTAQVRLLDTASPGGNLLASSKRVPIPSAELSP